VHRATVTRWIQKGKIKGAVRINGEKNWKIPITAYQELAKTKS
jgi:predicted site-specific integrase-resolvase